MCWLKRMEKEIDDIMVSLAVEDGNLGTKINMTQMFEMCIQYPYNN